MFAYYIWMWVIGSSAVYCSNWLWQCEDGYCKRNSMQLEREGYSSLKLCQLVCSSYLNIWPQPTGSVNSGKELININTKSIIVQYYGPSRTVPYLTEVTKLFENELKKKEPFSCDEPLYSLKIVLNPDSSEIRLNVNTNESYTLELGITGNEIKVNVNATTVFGIRHGLGTFLQILIAHTEEGSTCLSTISNVRISDSPKYRHRGLLIDTARNYLSVDTIKKQIDGMSISKLNVLHWHITDSQSFPLVSPRLPNMTKFGAYSSAKIYTPDEIKDLIEYAEYRGVRILIEIDGPSHAGMGWQWGPDAGLGNLAVCVNKQPWRSFCIQPPCGQLNPVNQHVYEVLRNLYSDIADISPDRQMFHMGGDEVFIPCWNSTPEILKYLKGKPLIDKTFLNLWAEYQRKNLAAYDTAIGHNRTSVIVWTSHLTQPEFIEEYLPKDRYIIQTWVPVAENDLITSLLKLGYKLIISTKDRWYLDHGFWGTTTYYKWKAVYDNPMYDYYTEAILGGEVCMWGELVDDSNVDAKVWPRAAAAAERMWSDPSTKANMAESRFFAQRERLIDIGIKAEAVIPQWCAENEGECASYL